MCFQITIFNLHHEENEGKSFNSFFENSECGRQKKKKGKKKTVKVTTKRQRYYEQFTSETSGTTIPAADIAANISEAEPEKFIRLSLDLVLS